MAVALACGTIRLPDIGSSVNIYHRLQVEAMLRGELALSSDPSKLDFDTAYVNGRVQQVWGLGVGLWRLLFEAPWRLLTGNSVPDRLPLVIAHAIVISFALRLARPWHARDATGSIDNSFNACLFYAAISVSPHLLNLYSTPMLVYEETIVYGSLFSTAQFLAVLRLKEKLLSGPAPGLLIAICFAAGLGPIIRPTLLFYGLATLIVSIVISRREMKRRYLILSMFGFLLPIVGLLWTNYIRFASPLEFGHSLNLTVPTLIVATRLQDPFAHASIASRI
ncbi:MAG: hypothetical protein MN733_12490, partial [Nitrososphaera sp.]|nr:hypothetical protein [Nitrososphaera sp.]